MSEIKTHATEQDPDTFLAGVEPPARKADAVQLKALFDKSLKENGIVWSNNMIGYGVYHYKSDRSTQEGDWPLIGFSPRKQYIAVYIMPGIKNYPDLLVKLGKCKVSSGSCLYINKLADIDTEVLKELIQRSVADMKKLYP